MADHDFYIRVRDPRQPVQKWSATYIEVRGGKVTYMDEGPYLASTTLPDMQGWSLRRLLGWSRLPNHDLSWRAFHVSDPANRGPVALSGGARVHAEIDS